MRGHALITSVFLPHRPRLDLTWRLFLHRNRPMQFTLSSCLSDLASPNKLHAQFSESERASERPSSNPSIQPSMTRALGARGRDGTSAEAKTGLLPHTSRRATGAGVAPALPINHHPSPPTAPSSIPSPRRLATRYTPKTSRALDASRSPRRHAGERGAPTPVPI
jgi:hypothetical protein